MKLSSHLGRCWMWQDDSEMAPKFPLLMLTPLSNPLPNHVSDIRIKSLPS